jgi:hypothetical protein
MAPKIYGKKTEAEFNLLVARLSDGYSISLGDVSKSIIKKNYMTLFGFSEVDNHFLVTQIKTNREYPTSTTNIINVTHSKEAAYMKMAILVRDLVFRECSDKKGKICVEDFTNNDALKGIEAYFR